MSQDERKTGTDRGFTGYAEDLLRVLARHPDRPAVLTADRRPVSAGELSALICRLARALQARGIGPGQTVSLLTGNTPLALAARYAVPLTGARLVYLYDVMPPKALAHIVADVDTRLLLVDASRHTDLGPLLSLVAVPSVASLGPAAGCDDLLASADPQAPQAPGAPGGHIDPHADWCIRHTSGTTGVPKALQVTHGQYKRCLNSLHIDAGDPPRFLANTPLSHVAGLCADVTLLQGGSVVLQPGFDAGATLAAVERDSVTHLWLLPPLLHQLLDHPSLATTDVSSIKRVTYGGSPASAARLARAAEVFGPVLHSWYGQSETLGLTEVRPEEHSRIGRHGQITVGRPMPEVELVIRDTNGLPLPAGDQGEIYARSPGMMRGYWKQPELTAETVRDGWIRTGDTGYLDNNGYLFLVGRSNDLIKIPGGGIYPSEVEAVLLTHPAIAQCAVFGVCDEDSAESIHAAVVPAADHRITPEEVRAHVTTHLTRGYVPSAIHFVADIPRTAIGKPDKNQLRSLLTGYTPPSPAAPTPSCLFMPSDAPAVD
ncbi:class I adenylate-forming enzyme family protein [Streptomyces sp. NPDC012769]|uniref:class I adenylate-forming enzyme family protein n=1 Tax=Streptomyces sp. NPDC012769 TaxID=3364848 RepID=UPI0036884003